MDKRLYEDTSVITLLPGELYFDHLRDRLLSRCGLIYFVPLREAVDALWSWEDSFSSCFNDSSHTCEELPELLLQPHRPVKSLLGLVLRQSLIHVPN